MRYFVTLFLPLLLKCCGDHLKLIIFKVSLSLDLILNQQLPIAVWCQESTFYNSFNCWVIKKFIEWQFFCLDIMTLFPCTHGKRRRVTKHRSYLSTRLAICTRCTTQTRRTLTMKQLYLLKNFTFMYRLTETACPLVWLLQLPSPFRIFMFKSQTNGGQFSTKLLHIVEWSVHMYTTYEQRS